MELLINFNGLSFSGVRVFNIGTNANPTGITLTLTSNGSSVTQATYSGTSGNLTGALTTTAQIPPFGWTHLVFAMTSGTTTTCYINGIFSGVTISSVTSASNFTLGTEWELGHNQYNDTGVPGASIAMSRVYNTSLNAGQVSQNYLHCITKNAGYALSNIFTYPYPPTFLTGNSSTVAAASYGTGTYVVSASTTYGTGQPYYAFNGLTNGSYGTTNGGWASNGGYNQYYTGSVLTSVGGSNVYGEWIQIQLPAPIYLTGLVLETLNSGGTNQGPVNFTVVGSNSGTAWFLVQNYSGVSWTTGWQSQSFVVTSPNAWLYYRIIATQVGSGGGYFGLGQALLYGIVQYVYPPAALTTNTTTTLSGLTYGNGNYTATASSIYGGNLYAYRAFDKNPLSIWNCVSAAYNTTTGAYAVTTYSTVVGGSTIYGEWLDLLLPVPIALSSYSIQARSDSDYAQTPYTWILAGTNNGGTTWTQVDSQTARSFTQLSQIITFTVNSTVTYNEYRIIITSIQPGGNGLTSIGDMYLYTSTNTNTIGPYTVLTFTNVGTTALTIPSTITNADILVVAGGGGGGGNTGSGGGAGGYQYFASQSLAAGSYTVTVGAGGTAGPSQSIGGNGNNSSFGTLPASIGGGCGNYGAGGSGGSGGGGGGYGSSGGTGVTGQGNAGGSSVGGPSYGEGGGGGAGSVGGNGTGSVAGNGGNGIQNSITGTATYYAGGGGGGINSTLGGTGGLGGGGSGGTPGINGTPNTGGGGGGGTYIGTQTPGGAGGSGIVIVRYPTNPGTFPLDSVSATPSLLFSTRRLRTGYTGPVIQLSLTNTFTSPQDFYFVNGSLNTNSSGTGSSFTTWVGAGTAYVSVWYDQSGNGKNASGVSGSAAVYNNVRGLVDFTGTGIYMTLPIGTLPSSQVPSSICFKNGVMAGGGDTGLLAAGTLTTSKALIVTTGTSWNNSILMATYNNDFNTTSNIVYGSVSSILASNTGTSQNYSIYINGGNLSTKTLTGLSFTPSGLVDILGSSRNNTGGAGAPSINTFNGQLYWLSIYNSALNVPDRMTVEMQ